MSQCRDSGTPNRSSRVTPKQPSALFLPTCETDRIKVRWHTLVRLPCPSLHPQLYILDGSCDPPRRRDGFSGQTVSSPAIPRPTLRFWPVCLVQTVYQECLCASIVRCVRVPSRFRHVWFFATLWSVACQASLSMGFSKRESGSGSPRPPPGDLPGPGIEPASLTLQVDPLPLSRRGSLVVRRSWLYFGWTSKSQRAACAKSS